MHHQAIRQLTLALSLLLATAFAAVSEVVTYIEMGSQGMQMMHAAGPEKLKSTEGDAALELVRLGTPEFASENPGYYAEKGVGSILFKDKADRYHMARALVPNAQRWVLEAWVAATRGEDAGLHAAVAHGNGAKGFLIAQQGGQWVAFVGGAGAIAFGSVTPELWEHLAVVYDNGAVTLYRGGEKVATQSVRWGGVHPNFSVGGVGTHDRESFAGKVCAVRLTNLGTDAFDAGRHLLLDSTVIQRRQEEALAAQRERLEKVLGAKGVTVVDRFPDDAPAGDWLVKSVADPVQVMAVAKGPASQLRLSNGLVSRTFYVGENLACVGMKNLANGAEYVRSVQPEARIQLDGTWYDVGGLQGQRLKAYLMQSWLGDLTDDGKGFTFVGLEIGEPKERYPWHPRYNSGDIPWPPKGKRVSMLYRMADTAKPQHRGTTVGIHYELYEGIPVICKYLTLRNNGDQAVNVDRIETEILALQQDQVKRIHMESDFSSALFNRDTRGSDTQHLKGSINDYVSLRSTTRWRVESGYKFYATHNQMEDLKLDFPHHNVMVCTVPIGPDETVQPEGVFTSMHNFTLLHDSDDIERKSLGHRRMYRVIAPQINESLVSASLSSTDINRLRPYIDQAAELGFESLSLQWPGVRIAHDNTDPKHIATFKAITDYASSKDIIIGAYELVVASRNRGGPNNVVHPETGKPGGFFGQSGCVGSSWWLDSYQPKSLEFMEKAGFGTWDIDGPYHGEPCAATTHPGHKGLKDSQWQQWRIFTDYLAELMRRDLWIPIPDWYFLNGQNVTSMGYREAAAGLSANLQLLLYRQYIYDGTWYKTPSMGWIEFNIGKLWPYEKNWPEYERWLVQGLGCGARINWRGRDRFWDTPEIEEKVKAWFAWYHRHREVLLGDIIHVARPSGRDVDAIFHVNPAGEEKGLAVVFNPLDREVTTEVLLPLYYTGIDKRAKIGIHTGPSDDGPAESYDLDREYRVRVPVTVPAESQVWLMIREG